MADELKISITATDGASKVFEKVERSAKDMGDGIEDAAEKAGNEFKEMIRAAQQMEQALDRNADRTEQSMSELGRSIDRLSSTLSSSLTSGARDAATALNRVETEAEQADTSLDQLDASSTRAGQGFSGLSSAAATAGAGIGLLGGAFVMYANQARDHEMAVAALGRTYGDTADQFLALADSMQSTTVFSNDQVIEAANLMGTLQRNYQMTSEEIQQLIQISADLAAVNGISLADASQRVAAAMRGEAESAEVLGLTMNDAAIGIDQLGASATEAEKAQFRLNAIIEQSAFASGAAADQAETTAGQMQQLGNEVQDTAQRFIEFTGPVGEAVSGISTWGIEAGLAASGAVLLAKGARDATLAMKGMTTVMAASGPVSALTGLIGSSGLAAGIAAAAGAAAIASPAIITLGGALYYLHQQSQKVNETADQQTDALTKWVESIPDDGDRQNLIYFAQDVRDFLTTVQTINPSTGESEVGMFKDFYDDLLSLDAESLATLEAILASYGMSLQDLSHIVNDSDALGIIAQAIRDVAIEQERGEARAADYNQTQMETLDQWLQSEAAGSVFVSTIQEQTEATEEQTLALRENAAAWDETMRAENRAGTTILTGDEKLILEKWLRIKAARTEAFSVEEIDAFAASVESVAAASISAAAGFASWLESAGPMNETFDALFDRMEDAPQRMNELAVSTERVARVIGIAAESVERGQDIWTAYNEALSTVTENMGAAADMEVLGDTFNTLVGQAQAWGQLSQSVADWAGGLAHGELAMTQLDQALLNGIISQQTYGAALEANHEIQEANADIQEDILRIQIKQLPVMADAIQQQAEYIDGLADLGPEAQLAALGFMDQAQAAKALEVAQLAAASATEGQQAATTAMIQEMAAADPVLAAMLEKMGLISIGADGTITVNFDDADSATVAIDNLTASIDALIAALGGIPPFKFSAGELEELQGLINQGPPTIEPIMETGQVEDAALLIMNTVSALPFNPPPIDITAVDNATPPANDAKLSVENIPKSWFTDIDAEDNASGPAKSAQLALNAIPRTVTTFINAVNNAGMTAQTVANQLDALNGKTVTTYINTVQTGPSLSGVSRRHGGMIDSYANGGIVASLAEAGPELLSFRSGGQALVPHPGVYMVEAGTSVLPAPATAARMSGATSGRGGGGMQFYGPVSLYPAGTDTYDAISQAAIRRGR